MAETDEKGGDLLCVLRASPLLGGGARHYAPVGMLHSAEHESSGLKREQVSSDQAGKGRIQNGAGR